MSKKILVVEGDAALANLAAAGLRDLGNEVTIADDGHVALDLATKRGFDLIVLDLMMPRIDGLEILRRIRAHEAYTPVLMLTSRAADVDRIVGLEIGADDYVTKPFSPRELVARVRAVLRRSVDGAAPDLLVLGELEIDVPAREVRIGGRDVRLAAREFDLLAFLARNPRRVFTRDQIMQSVWGYTAAIDTGTLSVHVRRLREKIEDDPHAPRRLETVWNVGYRLVA
jgi:DNA-binding response OmpR family regulator